MTPPNERPRPRLAHDLVALIAGLLAVLGATLARRAGVDTALFFEVNGWRALPDSVWETLGVAGLGLTALVAFAIGASRHPRVLATLPWMFGVGGGLTHLVKQAMPMERPASVVDAAHLHVVGPKLFLRSMPSGHAMTAVAAVCILVLAGGPLWRRPAVVIPAFALAVAIAISRVVSGAHWPADVLAGAALGWATALLSVRLADATRTAAWLATTPGQWLLGAVQVGAGAAMAMDQGYGRTLPIQWVLATLAVWTGIRTLSGQRQWARLRRRGPAEART